MGKIGKEVLLLLCLLRTTSSRKRKKREIEITEKRLYTHIQIHTDNMVCTQ